MSEFKRGCPECGSLGHQLQACPAVELAELEQRFYASNRAIAALEYKAKKYDDVVKALHVCDGGQYRNDTIESVIRFAREKAALEAKLAACEADAARLDWLESIRREMTE